MQGCCDLGGVFASRFVLVGDNDDVRTSKVGAMLVPPLAGAARVAGGDATGRCDRKRVLLALGDVDCRARGDAGDQFGEAEERARSALEVPDPAATAVGAPLTETLRLVAQHLVGKLTGLVDVVVGRDDGRPAATASGMSVDRQAQAR